VSFDFISIQWYFFNKFSDHFEVGVVYYRTAYDPKHFYNENVRIIIQMIDFIFVFNRFGKLI
jgi:hypothetical protein